MELVKPYFRQDMILCSYYFFSSVQAAEDLLEKDFSFIGVFKNSNCEFSLHIFRVKRLRTGVST